MHGQPHIRSTVTSAHTNITLIAAERTTDLRMPTLALSHVHTDPGTGGTLPSGSTATQPSANTTTLTVGPNAHPHVPTPSPYPLTILFICTFTIRYRSYQ